MLCPVMYWPACALSFDLHLRVVDLFARQLSSCPDYLMVPSSSLFIILEINDGWKSRPLLLLSPAEFRASQIFLSEAPCSLSGIMIEATFWAASSALLFRADVRCSRQAVGAPSLIPRAFAAARAAFVRCEIKSRSCSAKQA